MSHKVITAAALTLAMMLPATAQEITGASVSGVYHSFDNANLTALKAGADLSLGGGFALGGSVAAYNTDDSNDTGFNGTARLMYMMTPNSALGLFVSRDTIDDQDYDGVGLEVGFGSKNGRFELYYADLEVSNDLTGLDRAYGGIAFEIGVADNISIMVDSQAQAVGTGDTAATIATASLGVRYRFDNGPSVFAEFGSTSTDLVSGGTVTSIDEGDFIGIGAEMTFGRSSGALLSGRSVFETTGF